MNNRDGEAKRLFLYVVTTVDKKCKPQIDRVDKGMSAPNIVNNIITFGTCKPEIRTSLKSGLNTWNSYVVGFSPHYTIPRKILFVARVNELITFDQAWRRGEEDEAFKLKRGGHSPLVDDPLKVKMNGDIIVKAEDGLHYKHVGGVHSKDWDTYVVGGKTVGAERDVYPIGDFDSSRYFWKNMPILTEDVLERYWRGYPNMRGHRVLYDYDADRFLTELGLLQKPNY